jgi:hypothetical protein
MFVSKPEQAMLSFLDTLPTRIHYGSKFVTFAYGDENQVGSVITCVYSPFDRHGWRAVRFIRVLSETPGVLASEFIAERALTAEEIAHFTMMLQLAEQ